MLMPSKAWEQELVGNILLTFFVANKQILNGAAQKDFTTSMNMSLMDL